MLDLARISPERLLSLFRQLFTIVQHLVVWVQERRIQRVYEVLSPRRGHASGS